MSETLSPQDCNVQALAILDQDIAHLSTFETQLPAASQERLRDLQALRESADPNGLITYLQEKINSLNDMLVSTNSLDLQAAIQADISTARKAKAAMLIACFCSSTSI
ncbi:hypothetical protein GYA49_04320 [Candidatus Beckwithbacteria bacterium]|nr:hypothetical protein [Candidatus Beckwithbacteria bacterium]